MKRRYFLVYLSVSVLGFVFFSSREIGSMDSDKVGNLRLDNSLSRIYLRESLPELPFIPNSPLNIEGERVTNIPETRRNIKNKPLARSNGNREDTLSTLSSMDCSSVSPRREGSAKIMTGDFPTNRNLTSKRERKGTTTTRDSSGENRLSPRGEGVGSVTTRESSRDNILTPKRERKGSVTTRTLLRDNSLSPRVEKKEKAPKLDLVQDINLAHRSESNGSITSGDSKVKKERRNSKRNSKTFQRKGMDNSTSVSSMECCSLSPERDILTLTSSSSNDIFETGKEIMKKEQKLNSPKNLSQIMDDRLETMISEDGFVNAQDVFTFWISGSNKFIKVRGKMTKEDIERLCAFQFPTNLAGIDWTECTGLSPIFQQIMAFHFNPSLKVLDLLDDDVKSSIAEIAPALSKRTSLTTLNVQLNSTRDHKDILKDVIDPLINHKTLTTLALSNSLLSGYGATIAKVITGNTSLTALKLGNCGLLNPDAIHIFEALGMNTTLGKLDLCSNHLKGEKSGQAVADGLRKNKMLTELDLYGNQLNTLGTQGIAEALIEKLVSIQMCSSPYIRPQPQFLTSFNLGNNSIGDDGAERISMALKNNMTLTDINLSKNGIGPVGAKYIAEALAINQMLKILNLGDNQISDGVQDITNSLIKNTTLITLDLINNYIGGTSINKSLKTLRSNKYLKTLYFGKNAINAKETNDIVATFLKKDIPIKLLDLGICNITVGDSQYIVNVSGEKDTIKVFDFGKKAPEDIRQFLSYSLNSVKKSTATG